MHTSLTQLTRSSRAAGVGRKISNHLLSSVLLPPQTMLTQAERVHIALKAAGGIRYMQNLTHNGIKSMNLLCDLSNRSDMQVVVADLGCSIQGCGSTGSFDNDICNGTRQW
jgi:hypothetical protein